MRSTKARQEHFEWVSQHLRPGDEVCIEYVATGRASKPISKSVMELRDVQSVEEELQRLQTRLAEFEAHAAAEPVPEAPTWTRAPRPKILKVSTSKKNSIDARLGVEEQLQAVINLTSRGCVLEVDAMTVLADGSTNGKRWLQQRLRPGQRVKIAYAT
jgi:hypothetical protein